jgi:hypothetical protein
MADPISRVHYFDHQFLREEDFKDEQNYHLGMRRRHNRLLHTWGVAEGLRLSAPSGASRVTVSAGTAIDGAGREIALPNSVHTGDLSGLAGREVFVTIAYAEEQARPTSETGAEGNTRWEEKPSLNVSEDAPEDPSEELILGRATVDDAGKVVSIDDGEEPHRRRIAGATGGDLRVDSLSFSHSEVAESQWPRMRLERAPQRTELQGTLRVTGNIETQGSFSGRLPEVKTGDLANDAVTSAKLAEADGSTTQNTNSGAGVKTGHLQNEAVNTAKIAPDAVTEARLAPTVRSKLTEVIPEARIGPDAVTSSKLAEADNSSGQDTNTGSGVKTGHLMDGAVTSNKIRDGAVTPEKLHSSVSGGVVAISAIRVSCTPSPVNFETSPTKVQDVGTFRKLQAPSWIEATFQGRIWVASFTAGSTGARFELRIADRQANVGRAQALFPHAMAGGPALHVNITGLFSALGVGEHRVSMWVAGSHAGGTRAMLDMGCFSLDQVLIRELNVGQVT